jgi:hypothetical protein
MKPISLLAILVILVCVSHSGAQDLAGWEKFEPRTMSELMVLASNPNLSSLAENTVVFTNRLFPSQVTLRYTGESRKISSETKEFIEGWVHTVAHHPRLLKLFGRELLFTDGSHQYWLPVPNNGPNYERVLRKGEVLTLFIAAIGMKKYSGQAEWFFIVNKFERPSLSLDAQQSLAADGAIACFSSNLVLQS